MLKKNYLIFFNKINLIIEKNIKFLKGPHCKIQTPIRWKFYGKPGKRIFFKIKKNYKLALKKGKIKDFKIY